MIYAIFRSFKPLIVAAIVLWAIFAAATTMLKFVAPILGPIVVVIVVLLIVRATRAKKAKDPMARTTSDSRSMAKNRGTLPKVRLSDVEPLRVPPEWAKS